MMKVTKEEIQERILSVDYTTLERMTFCAITLKSGYVVHGTSAIMEHSQADDMAKRLAFQKAFASIYPLMAFHKLEKRYEETGEGVWVEKNQ